MTFVYVCGLMGSFISNFILMANSFSPFLEAWHPFLKALEHDFANEPLFTLKATSSEKPGEKKLNWLSLQTPKCSKKEASK